MKKIDWNAPMSRKNWAQVYAVSFVITCVYVIAFWLWYTPTRDMIVEGVKDKVQHVKDLLKKKRKEE